MDKNGYLCLKQNRKKMCNELRKFLGILPNASIIKDSDGIISFSYNELKFLFVSDNEDVNYIRLILPSVADVKAIKNDKNYYDIINNYNNNYNDKTSNYNPLKKKFSKFLSSDIHSFYLQVNYTFQF